MNADWDLIVAGGGAAGFFGAITASEKSPGRKILILEKSSSLLGKVRVSGGGRCNVTHDGHDPKQLSLHYPRGGKALIAPFHRFGPAETVAWFQARGVTLKTESDGRMFPVTDRSDTIIDCLTGAARAAGVQMRVSEGVSTVGALDNGEMRFEVLTTAGEKLHCRCLLIATGGTRSPEAARLAEELGHSLEPAVPSLFAFHIADPRLEGIPGLAVKQTQLRVGKDLESDGPLLITHQGVSGPAVLKLSAWGARELHKSGYQFSLTINWLPGVNVASRIDAIRREDGGRKVLSQSPFEEVPRRLWERLVVAAKVPADCNWSRLPKEIAKALEEELTRGVYAVNGKSLNKEEFVTCGGVRLPDIQQRTMESRICPGLYFAGEVLDVDGITGGYNFQNAWTGGFLAGCAIAERIVNV